MSSPRRLGSSPRHPWRLPLLIFLLALSPRIVQIAQLRVNAPTFASPEGGDSIFYHRVASGAPTQPRAYFHSPLYRAFVTTVYTLFGDDPITYRVLQALLGALGAVLALLLARRLFAHELVAAIAGLLHALAAPLVFYGGQLLPTTLLSTLLVAAMLAQLRWARLRDPVSGIMAGVLIALAALTRPTVLIWLPVIFVWALRNGGLRWRGDLLLVLALVLTIVPVTVRNGVVEGDWVPITANMGLNLYIGNNPNARGSYNLPEGLWFKPGDPLDDFAGVKAAARDLGHMPRSSEASRWWARRALHWMVTHPQTSFVLMGRKLLLWMNNRDAPQLYNLRGYREVASVLAFLPAAGVIIVPALLGLVLFLGRRQDARVRLYAWCAWSYVVAFIPFFVVGRYRAPWLALVTPAAAWALLRVASELAGRFSWRTLAWTGGLLGALAVVALPVVAGTRAPQFVAFGRAAQAAGDRAAAKRWYRMGWHEAPRRHGARLAAAVGLSRLLLADGGVAEAQKIVSDARRDAPRSGALLALAGEIEARYGHLAAAEALLRRALVAAPGKPATWIFLAAVCRARGEEASARVAMKSAKTLGITNDSLAKRLREVSSHFPSFPSSPSGIFAPSPTDHGKGSRTVLDP